MDKDLEYLIYLSCFYGFGPKSMELLMGYFTSPEKIFKADLTEMKKVGITDKTAQRFITDREKIDRKKILDTLEDEGIRAIRKEDPEYPSLLKEIGTAPYLLFVKGELNNQLPALAVVGSRKASSYGQLAATRILNEALPIHDLSIVSGMAFGIDSEAHRIALQNKTHTVAVLAGGINREQIYPKRNLQLARKIIENKGAIISEYPPFTAPLKQNFVQRNRIIAGMSLGTLIIEAQIKSGTLITARCALEEGREVMAVPGAIDQPNSRGTNEIIKKGAYPITEGRDIGYIFNLTAKQKSAINKREDLSAEESKTISALDSGSKHINDIARITKIPIPQIQTILSSLEIKGEVKNLGGMMFGTVK